MNVNVYEGRYFEQYKGKDNVIGDNARVVGAKVETNGTNGFPIPSHARGAIGAINTIFGGGNAAEVIGNTTVNIGTETGEEVEDYINEKGYNIRASKFIDYYTSNGWKVGRLHGRHCCC